jgi:2'-phosphotransferase
MPHENGVISGMRGTCDMYIQIDMPAAIKDGIKFYISSNNVILT